MADNRLFIRTPALKAALHDALRGGTLRLGHPWHSPQEPRRSSGRLNAVAAYFGSIAIRSYDDSTILPEQSFATGYVVQVVHILCDHRLQEAAGFPGGQDFMGAVRAGSAEVVVKDLLEDRPGDFGVREEVVQLQHARVVLRPQAARTAERRMPLATLIPAPVKAVRCRA